MKKQATADKTAADWFREGLAALELSWSADSARELREDRERALECFEEALGLDPDYPEAQLHRGRLLTALGRADEAVDAFVSATGSGDGDPQLWRSTAKALASDGRPLEALVEFDRVLARVPDDVEALHGRAMALTALSRLQQALEAWRRLLTVPRDHFFMNQARLAVARLLCQLGRPDAKATWRNLLEEHPDALTGVTIPEAFSRSLSEFAACREAYEAYLAARASEAHTWIRASSVWGRAGDHLRALDAAQRAVELAPTSGSYRYELGERLSVLERYDEAKAAYERALEDPKAPSLAVKGRLEMLRTHGVSWKR